MNVDKMVRIYRDEENIVGTEGKELANIEDVEYYTATTGLIIEGIFEVTSGFYHFVNLTFLDDYEACKYVKITL